MESSCTTRSTPGAAACKPKPTTGQPGHEHEGSRNPAFASRRPNDGEPPMPFEMKPLSCDPSRVRGMSERLIISHYENNYGGGGERPQLIEGEVPRVGPPPAPRLFNKRPQPAGRPPH